MARRRYSTSVMKRHAKRIAAARLPQRIVEIIQYILRDATKSTPQGRAVYVAPVETEMQNWLRRKHRDKMYGAGLHVFIREEMREKLLSLLVDATLELTARRVDANFWKAPQRARQPTPS